jgi:hypothetical protein
MRRVTLGIVLAIASLLVAATGAQAVVVNDQGTMAGVALVPGTRATLAKAGITPVTASTSPCDPWLSRDLSLLPSIGLCSRGGPVMTANETFALTWDPTRSYWTGTRDYVEQFLRDVADGSGTPTSPYAITSQYRDAGGATVYDADAATFDQSGAAENASKYGGACIDYGNPGGYTCQFGDLTSTGIGTNYPATSHCPVTGATSVCLSDADIQDELKMHLQRTDLLNHLMPGYTPLLVVLTPPDVEVCLDSAGTLCSVNGSSKAQFCSYHSQVDYNGTEVAYVVQPWTIYTHCDEPNLPVPANPDPAIDAGIRLVNPLSQGQIAAIVNPNLNGWVANDGSEINDNNGCVPDGDPADKAIVGSSAQNPYYLAPEFNNAGVIDTDPYVPACAHGVTLAPTFVVPSPIDQGDVVQFDGSVTNSTLIVPQAAYQWDFGDGTPMAYGASKEHTYAKGGTYTVTLTVIDRGGYKASLSQPIVVLGPDGQPVSSSTSSNSSQPGLHARIQLMPQSLQAVLREGVAMQVSSNEAAAGVATLSISSRAARRAHIRVGRGPTVTIARGTIAGIKAGTENLRLRLSRATAAKLARVGHTALTIRLALVAAGGDHLAIVAAGHY